MVKATFEDQLNFDTIDTYYADDSLKLKTEKDGRAVYVDTESDNRIILGGSNFSYDGDQVVGGTVNSVTFKGSEGGEFAAITGANYDAEKLTGLLEDRGVDAMLKYAFRNDDILVGSFDRDVLDGYKGDDVLRGRGGRDVLEGGKGDDILVGGGGSDVFVFDHGDGKDVVKDFDAKGGQNNQDYIGVESMDDISIRKSGSDTIIDFDDGHTLTLVDVHRSTISDADFQIM